MSIKVSQIWRLISTDQLSRGQCSQVLERCIWFYEEIITQTSQTYCTKAVDNQV